ncbi:MAG: hypothetical protein AVDCRST_MAG07-1526, partial [uncultured Frankineae bacterium]
WTCTSTCPSTCTCTRPTTPQIGTPTTCWRCGRGRAAAATPSTRPPECRERCCGPTAGSVRP